MADLRQIVRRWGGCLLVGLLTLLVVYPDLVPAQVTPEQSQQNRLRRRAVRIRNAAPDPLRVAAVSLRDNQLDINVQDQDLHDILNDIAAQGGIRISQLEGLPKKRLSLRFSKLPVVTGLKRLFRAAEVESYVLVTEAQGETMRVQRIMFFPPSNGRSRTRPRRGASRRPAAAPALRPPASEERESDDDDDDDSDSGSVFEVLKTNTAARRLLSQLVHPNEQVRERALERLVRLVDSDDKQAELLEFLEPLMEDLASEDRTEREEARQEVRKLLRR
ncbi:hypothetical protein [Candidatus Entotheonella palauensis]|uniref:hypothetical protein n=1 Tax=Candidatus Entotheonella palauensis TaxID=93172 RepID=UPI001177741A|nr:hypothetical protein [Candidatus Entotheonella palauensis]